MGTTAAWSGPQPGGLSLPPLTALDRAVVVGAAQTPPFLLQALPGDSPPPPPARPRPALGDSQCRTVAHLSHLLLPPWRGLAGTGQQNVGTHS